MIQAQCSDIQIGYVAQIIEEFDSLSGGEKFNKALTQELSLNPDILLLDEPTNHLDLSNRKSLIRLLDYYSGTLIIATHDQDLIKGILWHMDEKKVHVFLGNYKDYKHELYVKYASLKKEHAQLNQDKKEIHQNLMKEQMRAKKNKLRGEKSIRERKWPTVRSAAKVSRAAETSGQKKKTLHESKQDIMDQLSELQLPEIINPKFSLKPSNNNDNILITNGCIGYTSNHTILKDIHLSLGGGERLAIMGDNGSGKTTLIKAILGDPLVVKSGEWRVPKKEDIGYLDQHYKTLDPNKTVLENIEDIHDSRKHLNDFLFRTNEQVNTKVACLSGGEKARLCLAQIVAYTPRLLILDEVTNNLDLETKEHVIQILQEYPGTLIVISHEEAFLDAIGMTQYFTC